MTMKRAVQLPLAALLLLCALGAQGETIRAELRDKIKAMRADERVDVIVRCADKVDLRQFGERDRKLRRERLTSALKTRAGACERLLRAALRNGTQPTVLWAINGVAARVPVALVEPLAQLPGVESVALDAKVVKPAAAPASASSAPEWNLQAVRAPEMWALGHDGSGVVIAALDTGVDPYHPDIGPKWRGGSNSWFDPNGQHPAPYDADGHGTWAMGLMVGGAAGGSAIGMAPGAQWIAAKIFDDSGQSLLSRIHQGLQWVLDPDDNPATDDAPDIVNNSWYLQGTVNACSGEFADDIAALKTAGIAVVFAGGNSGPGANTSVSPSNDPQALAVGAVDAASIVADFSSRGASACDGGIYPRLVAPGAAVRTADLTFGGIFPNSYRSVSGTSFAAPHVAGALALLIGAMQSHGVPVSVSLLESTLAQTAVDLGAAGADNDYGAGLLDVIDAYDWLLANAGTPQPGQLQFSAAAYTVAENGGSIVLTVTRSGGSAGDVSVEYATADGSAAAGADYGASAGTLTLADGETSRTFAIAILDDAVFEGNESFNVILSNPSGGATLGTRSTALVTIGENDPQPQPGQLRFSAASYSVAENGGVASIEVVRTGGSDGTVSVNYATSNGSATAGADYAAASGTLTFGPGVTTRRFDIAIVDDAAYEGNETINLALSAPTGGATLASPSAAVLTIAENDAPSTDRDGDGYASGPDCNDDNASIHPGAAEIKHDGIDQDCNGYDLTIEIVKAAYNKRQGKLTVEATSALGGAAQLQLKGYGPMNWKPLAAKWTISVTGVGSKPASVTVTGVEGTVSAPVP
jgi:subtilisin family serine protease